MSIKTAIPDAKIFLMTSVDVGENCVHVHAEILLALLLSTVASEEHRHSFRCKTLTRPPSMYE
jgi:hypothetical protein